MMQTLVHFFGSPFETHAVLRHLETGSGHTACIGCLTRAIQDLRSLEQRDSFRSRRHVRSFGHAETTVLEQVLCVGFLNLVLGSTRHSDIAGDTPRTLTGEVLCLWELSRVLFDTTAAHVLEFKDEGHLLFRQSFGIIDESVGVTERQHFGTETHCFLCGILGYITGARDAHALAFKRLPAGSEHSLCEIASTVSGSFRTHERAAPVLTLTGQRARELITQTFVLTEHISYLATADTDITGRHVGVCTDMTLEFGHETLAETHYLCVRFATRTEV